MSYGAAPRRPRPARGSDEEEGHEGMSEVRGVARRALGAGLVLGALLVAGYAAPRAYERTVLRETRAEHVEAEKRRKEAVKEKEALDTARAARTSKVDDQHKITHAPEVAAATHVSRAAC